MKQVPFVNLARRYAALKTEIMPALDAVLSSGNYILGDVVDAFEREIAAYIGCRYALAVANGTDALVLALKALNVGIGDEVIVPANSFIASAGAVALVGATPVFCDVTDDLNIDGVAIEQHITDKTKVIMPVHLTGRPVNMPAILKLAERYGLFIVEDAAQSMGAMLHGKKTGHWGNIGCFSLHPLKNLGVFGDGGVMTMDDDTYYHYLKRLRNHGLQDRDTCLHWGYNSRLDAIHAKIASIELRHLDAWTERHRTIAARYRKSLTAWVKTPEEYPGCFAVYHNFVIMTPQRDALQQYLQQRGIETKIHYPIPLHLQPAAETLGYQRGDFPYAERFAKEMLSLPIYPELQDEEIDSVINNIGEFFNGVTHDRK